MSKYSAILFGGTGTVGGGILSGLTGSKLCEAIMLVTRKPVEVKDKKIKVLVWEDFDEKLIFEDTVPKIPEFEGYDVVFNSIGVKWNSVKEEFYRKIYLTYSKNIGLIAKEMGIEYHYFVTNCESEKDSWIKHASIVYEAEKALEEMKFKGFAVIRPSLVLQDSSWLVSTAEYTLFPFIDWTAGWFVGTFVKRVNGVYSILSEDIGKSVAVHFEKGIGTEFSTEINPPELAELCKEFGKDTVIVEDEDGEEEENIE